MPLPNVLRRGALMALLLPIVSCAALTDAGEDPGPVEVRPGGSNLVIGESVQLSLYAFNYSADAGGNLRWSSSNSSVARVDRSGMVVGVSRGQAVIRGESGGRSDTTLITVDAPLETVVVTAGAGAAEVGQPRAMLADGRDAAGNPVRGRTFAWATADSTIARIDSAGTVTPIAPGEVTITATAHGKTGQLRLTVRPMTNPWVSVQAGYHASCGLRASGDVLCWGSNQFSLLGPGKAPDTCRYATGVEAEPCVKRPVAIEGGMKFKQFSLGFAHACGLTEAGVAYCWGRTWGATPRAVPGGHVFTSLSTGSSNACGVTPAGALYCWGRPMDGNTEVDPSTPPVLMSGPATGGHVFASVSLGYGGACALTRAGKPYCWGGVVTGVRPDGGWGFRTEPRPLAVEGTPPLVSVSNALISGFTACGVDAAGGLWCWGHREWAPPASWTLAPSREGGAGPYRAVDVGHFAACGIAVNGSGFCWGSNQYGQLGVGRPDNDPAVPSAAPEMVRSGRVYREISISDNQGYHACGVTPYGEALCWGSDVYGELGRGPVTIPLVTADDRSRAISTVPVAVLNQ